MILYPTRDLYCNRYFYHFIHFTASFSQEWKKRYFLSRSRKDAHSLSLRHFTHILIPCGKIFRCIYLFSNGIFSNRERFNARTNTSRGSEFLGAMVTVDNKTNRLSRPIEKKVQPATLGISQFAAVDELRLLFLPLPLLRLLFLLLLRDAP